MTLTLILIGIAALLALAILFPVATAATANNNWSRFPDFELAEFPVAASKHIYRMTVVGIDPGGYLKPFEPGDVRAGIAFEESDNSSGTAGAKKCKVYISGDFEITLTGVALTDRNKPVFATDDSAFAFTGHPDAFIGRVTHYLDTNKCRIQLYPFGQSAPAGEGCEIWQWNGATRQFAAVTAAATSYNNPDTRLDVVGATFASGSLNPVTNGDETSMLLGTTSEVENITITGPMIFNITKAWTLDFDLRLKTAGGAATDDFDFGMMSLSTGIAATQRADMNAGTAGLKSALLHLDCNANDIFASSDDDANPIAATDTTVDNSLTVNTKGRLIGRVGGAVEVWIAGARKLSTTALAVSSSGLFAPIINLEKSTGAGVPEVRIRNLIAKGASA